MSRVRVYCAMSLDEAVEGPNDELDWLDGADGQPGPEEDVTTDALDFYDFLDQVGCLLMGRRTYDVVCGFDVDWPYGDRPVLVPTHRPLEPKVPSVRAVSGEIHELVAQAVAAADGKDVYVDGGALIRQAVDADLVDELVITVAPVVLGAGIPLFTGLAQSRRLRIESHRDHPGGMVQLVLVRP